MDKKIRKVDYFVVTLITLVFILIIAANTSLITDMVNNQAEEVGRIQLEGIKTEMQETLSEAENSLMKITVGVEQLIRESEEGHDGE